jgi:hypothetical protein
MKRPELIQALANLQKGLTPNLEIIKLAPRTLFFTAGTVPVPPNGTEIVPARNNRWKLRIDVTGIIISAVELHVLPRQTGTGIPIGNAGPNLPFFIDKPPCYKGPWYVSGTLSSEAMALTITEWVYELRREFA